MNVVGHAADFQRGHFILTRDAAEKGPKAFAKFRRDEWSSFFGAEHAMKIGTDVGHAKISAAPMGLVNLQFRDPQLKLRAIFSCPCGTGILCQAMANT